MRPNTEHLITHTLFFAPLTAGLAALVPMAVRLLPVDPRFIRASAVAVLVAGALFFALILVRGVRGKGWLFLRPVPVRNHLRGLAKTLFLHLLLLITTGVLALLVLSGNWFSEGGRLLGLLLVLTANFALLMRALYLGLGGRGWAGTNARRVRRRSATGFGPAFGSAESLSDRNAVHPYYAKVSDLYIGDPTNPNALSD